MVRSFFLSTHAIYLNDLLGLSNLENVKIKFNQWNTEEDPIDVFQANPELINNQWLFWRNQKRYFNVNDVAINLVRVKGDIYLLTTVKLVTEELGVIHGINYAGKELKRYRPLYGRVLIKYHKDFQASVINAESKLEKLVVSQVLPDVYKNDGFPGYDSVCLSYQQLKLVLEKNKSEWITALSNQKAVYLIRDVSNGKLYVGSATSKNGMLLDRWRSYISNGHGGNKCLQELIKEAGFEYVKKNFQYSILENYNSRVDDSFILRRESWWKKVFDSRNKKFGYNEN